MKVLDNSNNYFTNESDMMFKSFIFKKRHRQRGFRSLDTTGKKKGDRKWMLTCDFVTLHLFLKKITPLKQIFKMLKD